MDIISKRYDKHIGEEKNRSANINVCESILHIRDVI